MEETASIWADLRPNVAAAASYLDEREPGWAEKINLDTFDLFDVENCIGGQLYADDDEYRWSDLKDDAENSTGLRMAGIFSCRNLEPYWVEEIQERVQDPIQTAINNGGGDPRLETEPVEA